MPQSWRWPSLPTLLAAVLPAVAPFAATATAQDEPPPIPADVDPVRSASGLVTSTLGSGGGGPSPTAGDAVTVRYIGWLTDGRVFDRTAELGSARLLVSDVIEGLQEALVAMSVGDVVKVTVPPALAYGERGAPPAIPPDATLVYRIELLAIEAPPEFVVPGDDGVTRTPGGVTWRFVQRGDGKPCQPEQTFSLRYAVFDRDGRLLDGTFLHGGRIDGRADDMTLPFLTVLPLEMRVGDEIVARVPREAGFGDRPTPDDWGVIPDGETVWRLWLDGVYSPQPVPDFVALDPNRAMETESGVRFEVLRRGDGERPRRGEVVRCHYAGWLTDGTLFDTSYARGMPLEAAVGEMIPGFNVILSKMRPGAIWRVFLPAAMGYGEDGRPPKIPGGADLIYRIELLRDS